MHISTLQHLENELQEVTLVDQVTLTHHADILLVVVNINQFKYTSRDFMDILSVVNSNIPMGTRINLKINNKKKLSLMGIILKRITKGDVK